MAAVVLAACGVPEPKNALTSSTATTAPTESGLPATTGSVTVPGLGTTAATTPSSTTLARTPLPLTPVSSTPATTSAVASTTASTHSTTTTTTATATTSELSRVSSSTSHTSAESSTTAHPSSASSTSTRSTTTAPSTKSTAKTSTKAAATGALAGKIVAIDPGHNGGNAANPAIINAKIDGGYGYSNVCNTTGTETNAGYAEYLFNWNVAMFLRPLLTAKGITVVMTRTSDTGVGPCTNVRAQTENNAKADAVVSIHGDGAGAADYGFSVLTATRPPAGPQISAESLSLAGAIRDAMVAAGFPVANYRGVRGLATQDDLTGLNKSTRPKFLIECGNMRNASDAAWMSSAAGQRRCAQALANGVFAYLQSAG